MISFCVPVYKKPPEQFNRAVKSLLEMSVKEVEVIAVFDGEDKDLEPHAAKWAKKDKRFQYHVIEHGGACKARNAAARLAKGDYVAAWDADCYAEPEMAAMWLRTFKANPDCDFVYSGYKFTDPALQGHDAEPFDPWTLEHYNYIASMFPVKHSKMVEWDETLEGMQDWDYWRRIVKNGSKGRWIPGYGFWTEYPDKDSISGQPDRRIERIRKVRAKHGDKTPDILVHGQINRRQAQVMAKTLGADYFNSPFWITENYKVMLMMGLHPWELEASSQVFKLAAPETKKIIYWTGYDVDHFAMSPYVQVRALMNAINKEISHNLAMDERTLGVLEDLEVKKTALVPFPREPGEPSNELPEKFKVLAWADADHRLYMQSIASAMPDIEFEIVKEDTAYNLADYTVNLQFTNAKKLELGGRNALMMGRYVISNVQEPFAGYVDLSDVTKFKDEVIARIREIREKKAINAEAQQYYLKEADPDVFRDRIKEILDPAPPVLEVL